MAKQHLRSEDTKAGQNSQSFLGPRITRQTTEQSSQQPPLGLSRTKSVPIQSTQKPNINLPRHDPPDPSIHLTARSAKPPTSASHANPESIAPNTSHNAHVSVPNHPLASSTIGNFESKTIKTAALEKFETEAFPAALEFILFALLRAMALASQSKTAVVSSISHGDGSKRSRRR
jgi:hypothetical protein